MSSGALRIEADLVSPLRLKRRCREGRVTESRRVACALRLNSLTLAENEMNQKRSTKDGEPTGSVSGLGGGQGAGKGGPDQSSTAPSQHTDSPSDRPERHTGAGSEASDGVAEGADQHRSGYGGAGGTPVHSSDTRDRKRKEKP